MTKEVDINESLNEAIEECNTCGEHVDKFAMYGKRTVCPGCGMLRRMETLNLRPS